MKLGMEYVLLDYSSDNFNIFLRLSKNWSRIRNIYGVIVLFEGLNHLTCIKTTLEPLSWFVQTCQRLC